ncbi:hypothetical protein ACJMK2_023815 [Sinanodonta woodiana]|uniref:RRM domain-containing protein n=1 Tax=Sinanodonta woodiana TaxID=1069815 RepID=A0ABD3T642_SINWO
MSSSADVSPSITPCGTPLSGTHAPKYGTVIPNRIFVGGIAANTTEVELKQFFSAFGAVKDSKIIADRAGVSKGYGFITFENQEDAERLIKKEADNLVFKDRKLNIGPAIRKQQVLPRSYETVPQGTVLFTNGVPYTYQNGMAIFHAQEAGYPMHQPQVQPAYSAATALMMPQAPTVYMAPQYTAYQTSPQWTSQTAPWRWAPQSPGQAMTAATPGGYVFATMPTSPELMYAQPPPHGYQTADMPEGTMIEASPVEGLTLFQGSLVPMDQNIQPANPIYVTEHGYIIQDPNVMANATTAAACTTSTSTSSNTIAAATSLISTITPQNQVAAYPPTVSTTTTSSVVVASMPSNKHASASIVSYKKTVNPAPPAIATIPRQSYSTPTFLVKHGHKVQCVMMPPKSYHNGQVAFIPCSTDAHLEGVPAKVNHHASTSDAMQ